MNKKQIDKLDDDKIDEIFSELIREKMDNKTFQKWVFSWEDGDDICDRAEDWDTSIKKDVLKKYIHLLKNYEREKVIEEL